MHAFVSLFHKQTSSFIYIIHFIFHKLTILFMFTTIYSSYIARRAMVKPTSDRANGKKASLSTLLGVTGSKTFQATFSLLSHWIPMTQQIWMYPQHDKNAHCHGLHWLVFPDHFSQEENRLEHYRSAESYWIFPSIMFWVNCVSHNSF